VWHRAALEVSEVSPGKKKKIEREKERERERKRLRAITYVTG